MKQLFLCLSILGMVLIGCSKNDDEDNGNSNNNGNEQPELPDLPALPDPDDVCSAMDDINFMAYCYDKFDVNKDGKVSVIEANAVKEINVERKQLVSLKGIERFSNLENLNCKYNPIKKLDIRYNTSLINLYCTGVSVTTVDLSRNIAMTIIKRDAFAGSQLISINIPAHIELIESGAFGGCKALESVIFESNSKIKELGHYPNSGYGEVGIFNGCSVLKNVTLPNNIEQIGWHTFYDSGLEKVAFPPTLKIIGDSAFGDGLKEVFCHATTPPKFGPHTFSYYAYNFKERHVTLYVPEKYIDAYKDSDWKMFSEILPIK